MSWLEIIDIRFNQDDTETFLQQSIFPLLETAGKTELQTAGVFRKSIFSHQTSYNNCIQIFLVWPERIKPGKSQLGLLLAKSLDRFGLIEHTVWESCFDGESTFQCPIRDKRKSTSPPTVMHEVK